MTNEIHNLLISKIPTKFHCGISQTEHHAEFAYYGLMIIFEVVSCFAFARKQQVSGR